MSNKLEALQFSMSRLDKIITDADNKANFLLCFSIAVLGGMVFIVKDINPDSFWFIILLILTFISFSVSSVFSFAVIFPRYRNYGKYTPATPKDSIFFFENVKNIIEGKAILDRLTDEAIENDYINQMKQLSIIISRKMSKVKVAVWFTGVGIILTVLMFLMTFSL